VVPDDSGEGIIPGFSESLVNITQHLGAKAFITTPNAPGIKEAQEKGATLILTSTDDSFICQNLTSNFISHNGTATGQGFAQALYLMADQNIAAKKVLVIGAGPVGTAATEKLVSLGARVIIHDLILEKAQKVASSNNNIQVFSGNLDTDLVTFDLILEASTSPLVWPISKVRAKANIVAPGIPFSFVPSANYNLWSEPLATGTAVMLVEAALN
jgi:D-arabinose 1-dehydrogenase-like Zn-dependent alcohol dehydrogenase